MSFCVFVLVYLLIGLFIFSIIEGMQLFENSSLVITLWPLVIVAGVIAVVIYMA